MNAAGILVYGHDHLAHGETMKREQGAKPGYTKYPFEMLCSDVVKICEMEMADHPRLPFYLFGHSMGSVIAQTACAMDKFGGKISGLILSGVAARLNPVLAVVFGGLLNVLIATLGGGHILRTQLTIESNSLLQQNLIGYLIANLKRNLRGEK